MASTALSPAAAGTDSFEAVLVSAPVITLAAEALRCHVGGGAGHDWAAEVRSAIETQRKQP